MRPNPMRQRWAAGELTLGAWLSIPSSVTAEAVAANSFDYVCVDMQHGLVDYNNSVSMLQAITVGGATPLVRVPENQPGHIGKALDAGAMGVIVPMVNSVEECERAVAAARYAPAGSRSWGPTRAALVQGSDYWDRANEDVACIPMIETVAAVESLDGILSVPGVEAIYVGPSDLAISMGFAPASNEPSFLDVLDSIVAACRDHGVVPGIHTSVSIAQDRIERGFTMMTVVSDLIAMRTGVATALDQVRKGESGEGSGALY